MSSAPDAVVIGAGPNGLVAANALVDAGWSVLVLEAQPEPGGAVRSSEDVHAGFVHDTFSSYYPLAAASPTINGLHLEDHGLVWRRAPAVLGHPRPQGGWALLHPDREVTAALMEDQHRGDGAEWLRLCEQWDAVGDQLVRALITPFPPVRHGLAFLARLPRVDGLQFVRTLLTPATDLARRFGGDSPGLLLAGNAAHTDLPLDSAGSGLMGLLLTMLGQTVGYPVPEGGAGALTRALVRRLESRGGELRCSSRVEHVEVVRGRAVAVRTEQGERVPVGRAVLADVLAPALYGRLLDERDVPARTRRALQRFQLDPGTVKVDWALDGPVPWREAPAHAPGTVHVGGSLADMNQSLGQVASGSIPAEPFLLMGQTTTADPTRSPAGTEAAWAYTHVPQPHADGDEAPDAGAGGPTGRVTGRWDAEDTERFADRVQQRVEDLAPGFGDRVLSRRVMGPHELQAADENLAGGAINGGTAQLHQQLVFRPVPGLGRSETPVAGLFLASASAHPGGGVHGAPGKNAARAALAAARTGRLPRRP